MNAMDRAIVEEFATRVRAEIEPRARIWAYGSRVRGDADELSDLDVCVVLPGEVSHELRRSIGYLAWEVGFEREVLIQDVVFSEESFERGPMSASPLVKNILREGLAA
jgi:predicted nucleotidyltransferase